MSHRGLAAKDEHSVQQQQADDLVPKHTIGQRHESQHVVQRCQHVCGEDNPDGPCYEKAATQTLVIPEALHERFAAVVGAKRIHLLSRRQQQHKRDEVSCIPATNLTVRRGEKPKIQKWDIQK